MTRLSRVLGVVLVAEVLLGVVAVQNRDVTFGPPELDLDGYSNVTTSSIQRSLAELRPKVALDWHDLADKLFVTGFYKQSEACYHTAVQLQPDHPQFIYDWAFCLSSLGNLQLATKTFQRAIDAGHSHPEACHYFMGLHLLRQGQLNEARLYFEQSSSIAASRLQLADLAMRQGNLTAARKLLADLIEEHPNAWRIHHLLAEVATAENDSITARQHSELADVLSAAVPGPWKARAGKLQQIFQEMQTLEYVNSTLSSLSNTSDLQRVATQVKDRADTQWDPLLEDLMARLAYLQGDVSSQLKHLRHVVELDGMDAYRAARLGAALKESGQIAEAESVFAAGVHLKTGERASEVAEMATFLADQLPPSQPRLNRGQYLAVAAFHEGLGYVDNLRYQDALRCFEEAVSHDDQQAKYWYWLGRTYQILADRDQAKAAFAQCLKLQPHHERAEKYLSAVSD